MVETALNAVWIVIAAGTLAVAPRCTARMRMALLCGVAMLFPIISISDDFTNPSPQDTAAIMVMIIIAIVLTAVAHVHSVSARMHAFCVATPSDPRSPPRA